MVKKIYMVLFVLLIVFTLPGCNTPESAQKNIEKYLSSTYNKQFIVEKPKYYQKVLFRTGSEDQFKTYAYLKDIPEVRFEITWYPLRKSAYEEDYLQKYWSYQGKTELGGKLEELYSQDIKYDYGLSYYFDTIDIDSIRREFANLNYSGALKKVEGKSSIGIIYYIPYKNDFNKKVEADKAFRILKQFILEYKPRVYGFQVLYVPKAYFLENIKEVNISNGSFLSSADLENMHMQNTLFNYINLGYPTGETADSVDELINKFKY